MTEITTLKNKKIWVTMNKPEKTLKQYYQIKLRYLEEA